LVGVENEPALTPAMVIPLRLKENCTAQLFGFGWHMTLALRGGDDDRRELAGPILADGLEETCSQPRSWNQVRIKSCTALRFTTSRSAFDVIWIPASDSGER
jgi:hypothetical protein